MAALEAEVLQNQQLPPIDEYEFSGDNDTVVRKCAFIQAYRDEGSIYHAALTSRISRKTVYRWIDADEQFALAIEESKEDCYDKVETSVFKKALAGDSLLSMFYLKAHRPKFRDRVTLDVEVVKNEIEQRMAALNLERLPQLPPAMMSEFIPVEQTSESSQCVQFPPPSAQIQKELDLDSSPESSSE